MYLKCFLNAKRDNAGIKLAKILPDLVVRIMEKNR